MLRPTVSRSVCFGVKHPSGVSTRLLLLSESCDFVDVGRSLWWENGSVVYNCCLSLQRCHSWVRVLRESWPYFTLSDSRYPNMDGKVFVFITHRKKVAKLYLHAWISISIPASQSRNATDGQSISNSWCPVPCAAHDQMFITLWTLRSCFCGAPSLARRRICLSYMLLVLVSIVFLGSESLGTSVHLLLYQIWDFPFCRLLRLAGSRRRYSNPPPHGWV
jgi:hypothetical protein